MQKKTDDLDICGGRVGLKPSLGKSKVMVMKNGNNTPIQILGADLQQVEHFTYLGSVTDEKGGTHRDIVSRLSKARAAFYKLRPVLSSAMYSTMTQINLYCSNVKFVLLYEAENWKMNKKEESTLHTFQNRCLSRILGIQWADLISNDELSRRTGVPPVSKEVKKRR